MKKCCVVYDLFSIQFTIYEEKNEKKRMELSGYYLFILVFCHIMLGSRSLRHHHGHAAAAILSAEGVTMGGPTSSSSPRIFTSTSSQNTEESSQHQRTANKDQQLQHFQELEEIDDSERMSSSLLKRDLFKDSQQPSSKNLQTDSAKDEGESAISLCDTCLLSESDIIRTTSEGIISASASELDKNKEKAISSDSFNIFTFSKSENSMKKQSKTENEESREFMNDEPAAAPVLIHKIKVKPGHELKLKCDLNNTYGRIQWILNGNPIRTDNGRYAIQGPSSRDRSVEGRLTINNVLPEDNGVWQCHETKFDGKEHISKPTWVIVLASPTAVHLELDGRPITPSTISFSQVTVREKEDAKLECVVEGGNPPPKVFWFLGSVNMTNNSQISSEYLEGEKVYITRSTFFFSNVSRSDHNKTVLCVVDHELLNQAGESESALTKVLKTDVLLASLGLSSANLKAAAQINVEYAPSFVISRIPGFGYPIREGISMALKCEVDANPKSSPQWVKDGGKPPVPQTPDGFLNFTEVSRNHSGWYKCISHHPLGNFSSVGYYLTVRFEPTITHQPAPRVEARLGSKLKMKCEADGSTSPALCWSRIGYGGSLTTVGSGQDLIVDKILYQEAGNYRCVAQNRVGLEEKRAQTSDILVVVTGRPVVYPTNRTIMGFAGQPLSLSLEMCANPPPERAFWVFGNVALRPGSKLRNKFVAQKLSVNDRATDCYFAVLAIHNVSEDDAGEYTFFVRNSKGVHEGTVVLNITPASYSVSNSRAYGDSPLYPASSFSPSLQNLNLRILIFTSGISVMTAYLDKIVVLVSLLFTILVGELSKIGLFLRTLPRILKKVFLLSAKTEKKAFP